MSLAALIFAQPNLNWTPLEHLESFSGDMSITLGEWKDTIPKRFYKQIHKLFMFEQLLNLTLVFIGFMFFTLYRKDGMPSPWISFMTAKCKTFSMMVGFATMFSKS